MLESYKNGSDLTIMNTFYQFATKDADGNKVDEVKLNDLVFNEIKTFMDNKAKSIVTTLYCSLPMQQYK